MILRRSRASVLRETRLFAFYRDCRRRSSLLDFTRSRQGRSGDKQSPRCLSTSTLFLSRHEVGKTAGDALGFGNAGRYFSRLSAGFDDPFYYSSFASERNGGRTGREG
ncbi:hypothetical protein PUN28_009268 [Cardiocondyla obscurior]|uniref:Uncharacterized protein n=1 Tax=Cardiocondyla obscurior TaxID=286306 RepID=A0AAW2FWT4_9HYME